MREIRVIIFTLARMILLAVILLSLTTIWQVSFANAQTENLHPLEIHMNQWIRGSGQWRSPNPNYDPNYSEEPASVSFKDYGINWSWNPARKIMEGEITGVMPDGSEIRFWTMYAFYNPATETVIYQQVSRRGSYVAAEGKARTDLLEYGEMERLEALEYRTNGEIQLTRHENFFYENGTQKSYVYERDENGKWELANEWLWVLTSAED